MDDMYIYSGTKRLRCGFTTGTCAAAASKAAAVMLLAGSRVSRVSITLPGGGTFTADIEDIQFGNDHVSCCVVKDSGDDPDITNGIRIYSRVSKASDGICITGGRGVGRVTMPGLDQPVGEYAINSVPRRMIARSLEETAGLYDYNGGFHVVISVPRGEELAAKTFNPVMGIRGGISIIGTTGIVEPMSSKALVDTVRVQAKMRRELGDDILLLTIGNYSESFISAKMDKLIPRCVMCSNYIGEAIDIGLSLSFKKILIIGHIGKLVKLGAGIMNTHSSYADGRMEALITCAALSGVKGEILAAVDECVTVDAAVDILYENDCMEKTLDMLIRRIEKYLTRRVKGSAEIAAVVFSFKNDLLLKTDKADDMLSELMGGA